MTVQPQRRLWIFALGGLASACLGACRPSTSAAQKPGNQDRKLVGAAGVKQAGLARKAPRAATKPAAKGLSVQALTSQWSQRRALSCKVQLKVIQGAEQNSEGKIAGRIAWSREPSGAERLRLQLEGTLGTVPCRVRVTSMGEGILLERWNPALQYATTRRHPAQTLPIASMTQLAVPMVVSALKQGCAPLLSMPPAASQWTPGQSLNGPDFVSWSTPQGARQTLWVEPNKLPKRRELQFKDAQGQPVRWSLSTQCQSS